MLSMGLGPMLGSRKRIVMKTVGYRIASIVLTVAIAFLVVGDTAQAVNIGVLANGAKMGLYYAHERAWSEIDWGRTY